MVAPDVVREDQSALLGSPEGLRFTDDMARMLYKNFDAQFDLEVFIGEDRATGSQFLNRIRSTSYGLMHLIAHGERSDDYMHTPGFLLHSDMGGSTLITHKELDQIRAPWIAILSACELASAEPRPGDDGGHHIGGTLLSSGSNSVICSALPVEYRESQLLSGAIIKHLSKGHNSLEALFLARQDTKDSISTMGRFAIHLNGLGTARIAPVSTSVTPHKYSEEVGTSHFHQKWKWLAGVAGLLALVALTLRKTTASH